jgi:hypothetical protein
MPYLHDVHIYNWSWLSVHMILCQKWMDLDEICYGYYDTGVTLKTYFSISHNLQYQHGAQTNM